MEQGLCKNCGADVFIYRDGAKYCKYCNSRYEITEAEKPKKASTVSLRSDIDILLEKCKAEPANAKKYAGLILDIDPTNSEAKKFLNGPRYGTRR